MERSNETRTPEVVPQTFRRGAPPVLTEPIDWTTPLKVPGVLKELSASATYVGVVEPAVAIAHDTLVSDSSNQLG